MNATLSKTFLPVMLPVYYYRWSASAARAEFLRAFQDMHQRWLPSDARRCGPLSVSGQGFPVQPRQQAGLMPPVPVGPGASSRRLPWHRCPRTATGPRPSLSSWPARRQLSGRPQPPGCPPCSSRRRPVRCVLPPCRWPWRWKEDRPA